MQKPRKFPYMKNDRVAANNDLTGPGAYLSRIETTRKLGDIEKRPIHWAGITDEPYIKQQYAGNYKPGERTMIEEIINSNYSKRSQTMCPASHNCAPSQMLAPHSLLKA